MQKERAVVGLGHSAFGFLHTDLCIVNICTVTAEGDVKSRQTIRRLHQAHPRCDLVVLSCFATRDPEAIRKLPGVTKVVAVNRTCSRS